MEIRPIQRTDIDRLGDIDSTSESSEYLHIDKQGEGLALSWKTEVRRLREKRLHRAGMTDEQLYTFKQLAIGAEEGVALVAEHDGALVAAAAAMLDPVLGPLRLLDLRVDFDFRRQGLASAMMFQLIQEARNRELRAVAAVAQADNVPAIQLLAKLGFEMSGLDTLARSNHDLVKETVNLFFYLLLN